MGMKRLFLCSTMVSMLAMPVLALSTEKGHEGMPAKPGGHDMVKMEDKVFSGKIGPWKGTARIIDMKAHLEASGVKTVGTMPNTHHIALELSGGKTKAHVTEGKGTVTVTGPDKKNTKSEFIAMQGHFGADVNLPAPGKYTFKAQIESGGKKGSATFFYQLK